jgi:hypothetical protein
MQKTTFICLLVHSFQQQKCSHICNTSSLKCVACLYAKALTRSPTNLAPTPSTKNHILKQDHLKPWNCISADHYFSPVPNQLPHTFGNEQNQYTCGRLFVDHARGKYSTFLNIQTLPRRRSEVHFIWKQWHWMKVSKERDITSATVTLLQQNPKNILHNKSRLTLLVVLGLNIKTILPNTTSTRLHNWHVPICSTW